MKRCKMPFSSYSLETVVLVAFSFLCAKYCLWEKFSSLPSAAAIQFTPRSINPDSLLRYPGSYSGIRILLPVSGGSSPVSGSHSGIRFFCRYPGFYYGIRILLLVSGGSSSGFRVLILASRFSSRYPGGLLSVSGGSSSGFRVLLPVSGFLFRYPDFYRFLGSSSGFRVLLPVSEFFLRFRVLLPVSEILFWHPGSSSDFRVLILGS